MDEMRKKEILSHLGLLARQTLIENWLDSVNGSEIYQVPSASWQRCELLKDNVVCTVQDAIEFEGAVQNPKVFTIFVPATAYLTQEIAIRILVSFTERLETIRIISARQMTREERSAYEQ